MNNLLVWCKGHARKTIIIPVDMCVSKICHFGKLSTKLFDVRQSCRGNLVYNNVILKSRWKCEMKIIIYEAVAGLPLMSQWCRSHEILKIGHVVLVPKCLISLSIFIENLVIKNSFAQNAADNNNKPHGSNMFVQWTGRNTVLILIQPKPLWWCFSMQFHMFSCVMPPPLPSLLLNSIPLLWIVSCSMQYGSRWFNSMRLFMFRVYSIIFTLFVEKMWTL